MTRVPLQLVTLVAETVLEDRLTRGLRERGATGFTITRSRGEGSRGIRTGEIPGESVRIEVIVDHPTADEIFDWMQRDYFPHYAVIAWVAEVQVLRGEVRANVTELNHRHLRYFWVVAREGSVTGAAELLGVAPSTVSTQVALLEESLGVRLFRRVGNRLEITGEGRTVHRYASDIFALSQDLVEAVGGGAPGVPSRFAVGIVDSLPLLSAHHLLEPALSRPIEGQRVILRVDKSGPLLGALTARTLDMVLTDTPGAPTDPVRAEAHLLVESPVELFAAPPLAGRLVPHFPESLQGAPFILHTENTPLRRGVDAWLIRNGIRPTVAAEVEDVGFLQLLGEQGRGVFAAPSLVADQIRQRYGVEVVGRVDGVLHPFYALTLHREPTNPGVRAVLEGSPR